MCRIVSIQDQPSVLNQKEYFLAQIFVSGPGFQRLRNLLVLGAAQVPVIVLKKGLRVGVRPAIGIQLDKITCLRDFSLSVYGFLAHHFELAVRKGNDLFLLHEFIYDGVLCAQLVRSDDFALFFLYEDHGYFSF